MAEERIGNAVITVTSPCFSDGRTTGYLEFYDERHRPSFPLTSDVICTYLLAIVNEPCEPDLWKVGWIEALLGNDACTFMGMLPACSRNG
jgi:hypothetical protein